MECSGFSLGSIVFLRSCCLKSVGKFYVPIIFGSLKAKKIPGKTDFLLFCNVLYYFFHKMQIMQRNFWLNLCQQVFFIEPADPKATDEFWRKGIHPSVTQSLFMPGIGNWALDGTCEGRNVFMLTLHETSWQHQLLTFTSRCPARLPLPPRSHTSHVVSNAVTQRK